MKLPRRTATPKNPRITPAGKAEHALLQHVALQIGQEALRQAGITWEPTYTTPTGAQMGEAPSYAHHDGNLRLLVHLAVEVNPTTTAVVKVLPRHPGTTPTTNQK